MQVFLLIFISKTTRSRLDPNELDSFWVLDAILTCELLNHHV